MNANNFGRQAALMLQFTIVAVAILLTVGFLKYTWPTREDCVLRADIQACSIRAISQNVGLFNPLNSDDFTVEWVGGQTRRVSYDPGWNWINEQAAPLVKKMLISSGFILFGTILVGNLVLTFFGRRGGSGEKKHQRGAQIVDGKKLARITAKEYPGGLTIAGIPTPRALEPLSFRFAGSPGSGKSQGINRMALEFRRRGDCAVIADAGGELMAGLKLDQDVILNPFDSRSVGWSPFAEISNQADADRIARSLIPDLEGKDAEWNLYARHVLVATLSKLMSTGRATNGWLTYFCCSADKEEWAELVAGTPAQRWFDQNAERAFSSIAAIISTYLTPISYLDPAAGADAFSIGNWVKTARENRSVLWIPYRPDSRAAIKDLAACWIDLVTVSSMSQRSDRSRRLWIVVDELCAIGKISALRSALAEGRKFGLSAIVGYQSVSQLREVYGQEGHKALLSCLQNKVVLSTSDAESAEALAKDLGEAEVSRLEHSHSSKVGEVGSRSTREARAIEKVVLASEIQSLPPLQGFLKLAGNHPIARVQIPVLELADRVEPWIPAAGVASTIARPAEPVSTTVEPPVIDADADEDQIPDPDVLAELDDELQAELEELDQAEPGK